MNDRCAGSLTAPTETVTEHVVANREGSGDCRSYDVLLGSCETCGSWIGVTRGGRLFAHVNWDERNQRERNR